MSMPASRPDRPRLTAAQGSEEPPLSPALSPAKRGRGSQEPEQERKPELPRRELFAVAQPLRTECAPRWRAPLRGPLCSGGRAEEKPEGWPAWTPASLSSAQDVLSTNPVARTRTSRAGCPRGAEAGWPFSLATFSLATQRESSSRSARSAKAFALAFQKQEHRAQGALLQKGVSTSIATESRARKKARAEASRAPGGAMLLGATLQPAGPRRAPRRSGGRVAGRAGRSPGWRCAGHW